MDEKNREILAVDVPTKFKEKAIYTAIIRQEVGEEKEFPLEKVQTVRTYCSQLGLSHQRKYITHSNRETRMVYVKRVI